MRKVSFTWRQQLKEALALDAPVSHRLRVPRYSDFASKAQHSNHIGGIRRFAPMNTLLSECLCCRRTWILQNASDFKEDRG